MATSRGGRGTAKTSPDRAWSACGKGPQNLGREARALDSLERANALSFPASAPASTRLMKVIYLSAHTYLACYYKVRTW